MDFRINMMDLCDMAGGMYNAVEFLMEITKKCNLKVIISGRISSINPKIKHFKSLNGYYCKLPGDEEGIDGIAKWTYGYLKTLKRNYMIFCFYDVNEKDIDLYFSDFEQIILDKERKKEEMRNKMKEIDPYGEEDWLDENRKIMTKFNIFLNEKYYDDLTPYTYDGSDIF